MDEKAAWSQISKDWYNILEQAGVSDIEYVADRLFRAINIVAMARAAGYIPPYTVNRDNMRYEASNMYARFNDILLSAGVVNTKKIFENLILALKWPAIAEDLSQ